MFNKIDFNDFWDDSDTGYTCKPFDDEILRQVELKLGVKLPKSYVQLMKQRNGGILKYHGKDDEFEQILGISLDEKYSCLAYSNENCEEWFDEKKCVVFGYGCVDAYMYVFDYTECGPMGEPKVGVVITDDPDYRIDDLTIEANSFDEFMIDIYMSKYHDDNDLEYDEYLNQKEKNYNQGIQNWKKIDIDDSINNVVSNMIHRNLTHTLKIVFIGLLGLIAVIVLNIIGKDNTVLKILGLISYIPALGLFALILVPGELSSLKKVKSKDYECWLCKVLEKTPSGMYYLEDFYQMNTKERTEEELNSQRKAVLVEGETKRPLNRGEEVVYIKCGSSDYAIELNYFNTLKNK